MKKNAKLKRVFHEFKAGTLHHGSKHGKIVTDPKVAQAIALRSAGVPRKAGSQRK